MSEIRSGLGKRDGRPELEGVTAAPRLVMDEVVQAGVLGH